MNNRLLAVALTGVTLSVAGMWIALLFPRAELDTPLALSALGFATLACLALRYAPRVPLWWLGATVPALCIAIAVTMALMPF